MKVVLSLDVLVDIGPVGGVVPIMTAGSDMVIQSISLFRPMMSFATFPSAAAQEKAAASAMHTTNVGDDATK